MISALIGLDVKLVQILPNESRLGADYTLVIMDIIVEASDGSIVNVEVQKIGCNFPGEQASRPEAAMTGCKSIRPGQKQASRVFDTVGLSIEPGFQ